MVFQLLLELELLAINKLQLQLELTDAYFSVITGFQLQLLLTGITLGKRGDYQNCSVLYCVLKLHTVISTLR